MVLNIESCSREEACTLLGESEKSLDELRDRLQDWLKLQPHLPQDVPKKMLEHFILGTKMSLEQAKRKLDMFYTMRRLAPELLLGKDPRLSGFTLLHTMMEVVYLPKLTPEKYRVCIMRVCGNDYSKFNPSDFFKYTIMIEDILTTASCMSLGNIYVFDHAKITLGFLGKFTPTYIKKTEVTVTEAYAKRIKRIHLVNAGPFVETVLTIVKRVVKPKLIARIHVHAKGDFESFYQHVPKSILPKDYGGEEPSMTHLAELWRQKVDEYRDWFLEQDKIMVDERLRPGPAVSGDDLFGFSGSFRKLEVD